MDEKYEKIKEYVLILTGFEDSSKLDLEIETIIDECLEYCYRKDIPEAMEKPLAEVISTELAQRKQFGFDGNITSYREGDMSISYAKSSINSSSVRFSGKLEGFKQVIGAGGEEKCSEIRNAK